MNSNEKRYISLPEAMKDNKGMTKKKRELYGELCKNKDFWAEFKKNIKNTKWNKKVSKNSYSFCEYKCYEPKEKTRIQELLFKIFVREGNEELKEENDELFKAFKTKFEEAVSGGGQELTKITTLHSSSLCCLLFFYNVSENNRLTLKFETNKGERRVTFTKSVFEFKNIVTLNKNAPSNVDVVLIGEDEKKKRVFLFLESKFAEYYLSSGEPCALGEGYFKNEIGAKFYKIKGDLNNDLGSMDYGKSYELDGLLKSLGVTIKKNKLKKNGKDKDVYTIQSNKISYIDGIKQMISHYIGIKNLISEQYYSSKEKQLIETEIKNKDKDDIIYILGEIAFELPHEDAKKALKNYRDNYKLLAKIIAKQEPENSRFEILKDLKFYSEITEDERTKGEKNNYKVDEKVKLFYGMN